MSDSFEVHTRRQKNEARPLHQPSNTKSHIVHYSLMASTHLSARMRYLQNSAQMLLSASPETSAFLMSQVNQLKFDHEILPSQTQRPSACGACGSIMIPGQTCSFEKEACKSGRRRAKSKRPIIDDGVEKSTISTTSIVYKCNHCGRKTRHRFPVSSTTALRKGSRQVLKSSSSLPATASAAVEKQTTTSSKKRARARKQGGLQALLAAKKENGASGSGFGLDLMDLMKSA